MGSRYRCHRYSRIASATIVLKHSVLKHSVLTYIVPRYGILEFWRWLLPWSKQFDDPIILPDDRKLETLRDAAGYIGDGPGVGASV
jgi:hypothetical protein